MAQSWFKSEFGKSRLIAPRIASITARTVDSTKDGLYMFDQTYQITPLWEMSEISTYLRTNPILLVPVKPILFLDTKGMSYSLVFFRDSLQQITARLQVYRPTESYLHTHTSPNVQDFSGLFYQIDLDGKVQRLFALENGHYIKRILLAPNSNIGRSSSIIPRGGCGCFNAGSGESIWEEAWCLITCLFEDGGGSGGNGDIIINGNIGADGSWLGLGSTNGYSSDPYSGNISNGGGGSSSNLNTEIDNTLFDVAGQTTVMAYYQGIYMFQMGFSDTEFEDFYFNQRLFTQVEHFLQTYGRTQENIQIIRTHRDLLLQYPAYNQANSQGAWSIHSINSLKNYIAKGFSIVELVDMYSKPEYINAVANANYPDVGSEAWEQSIKDPILIARYLYAEYTSECAILKKQYPFASISDIRWTAFKNVMNDATHIGLDMCGLFPLLGEPCDIANGMFYSIQGEGVNAALSFGSAIPIWGWVSTGSKYALKVIGISGRTYKLSYEVAGQLIKFGDKDLLRAQLRRILNTPTGFQAHHIVPLDLVEEPLVQLAAKAKAPFHINEFNNGINISNLYHNGSHPNYSLKVKQEMERIYNANMTPQVAQEELQTLLRRIKTAILASPTTNINDVIF